MPSNEVLREMRKSVRHHHSILQRPWSPVGCQGQCLPLHCLKFGSDLYDLISMNPFIMGTLTPAILRSHLELAINFLSSISKHPFVPEWTLPSLYLSLKRWRRIGSQRWDLKDHTFRPLSQARVLFSTFDGWSNGYLCDPLMLWAAFSPGHSALSKRFL